MSVKLESVVPWGRSRSEYLSMFNLNGVVLHGAILDCAGGPSSFNAEMTRLGYRVISCDPIYQFSPKEIGDRIRATYPIILEKLKANREKFVWQKITSPERLGQVRLSAMTQFLEDFPNGLQQGRYLPQALPHLSWETAQFELALCSHFLFTYSEQFSLTFHLDSIMEMGRVAREVRVFPLVENFTGELSPHLEPVCRNLRERGYAVAIEQVDYEFQRNGNQVLRIHPSPQASPP